MVRDLDPINKGFDPLNSEHILKKNKHIIQNTRMSHAEVELQILLHLLLQYPKSSVTNS